MADKVLARRTAVSITFGGTDITKDIKGEWVIDEEAAAVVRRIFQMVMDGQSVNGIARTLRAEQIPIPSEHWKRIGCPVRTSSYRDPYAWSATTLGYILKRPEYLGRKVLGKTVCENYKTKSTRRTAPEEQFVFEGAVPAIIDEETWHNVQRLRETTRRTPKPSMSVSLLRGGRTITGKSRQRPKPPKPAKADTENARDNDSPWRFHR